MADKEYASVAGFVQFDVDERESNGSQLRDVTVRSLGVDGKLVRITLWPEFAASEVQKGDFVAADGTYEVRQVGDKTYVNLNAKILAITPGEKRLEREVTSRKTTGTSKF